MRYKEVGQQVAPLSSLKCIGYILRCSQQKYLISARATFSGASFTIGVFCQKKRKWLIIQYHQGTIRAYYTVLPPEFEDWDTKLYRWGQREFPAPTILKLLSEF